MPWWVLNVLTDLIQSEHFNQAEIFTTFSDRKYLKTNKWNIKIKTALPKCFNYLFLKFYNKKNILSKIFDYRNLMPLYPFLMQILSRKIKKYSPSKVVISSFAIAKNLNFCKNSYKWNFKPKTFLYLHSPMQYIRSHKDEYLQKLSWFKLKIFKYLTPKLKKRDLSYTNFDQVVSNSKYTSNLAKKIYNIDSKISYPKISEIFIKSEVSKNPQNYFIYVGRLVRFVKELDKIITLFNKNNQPLLVMWSGPDEEYLKSISNWNIIFIWRISDPKEKKDIIKNSRWLINITKESFGICTAEALLLWVPVFAYNDWASLELLDPQSGVLSPQKDTKILQNYFDIFLEKLRDREKIKKNILAKLGQK